MKKAVPMIVIMSFLATFPRPSFALDIPVRGDSDVGSIASIRAWVFSKSRATNYTIIG
jgi:hypothetical protein